METLFLTFCNFDLRLKIAKIGLPFAIGNVPDNANTCTNHVGYWTVYSICGLLSSAVIIKMCWFSIWCEKVWQLLSVG